MILVQIGAEPRHALAFGEQAGIPAMTFTRLLAALDRPVAGRPAGLARGAVLVVDEAGMLGPALVRLLTHARTADAKLERAALDQLRNGDSNRAWATTTRLGGCNAPAPAPTPAAHTRPPGGQPPPPTEALLG